MDGRKRLFRQILIATLAWTNGAIVSVADDFIRPPVKSQHNTAAPNAIRQPARNITGAHPVPAISEEAVRLELTLPSIAPTPAMPELESTPVARPSAIPTPLATAATTNPSSVPPKAAAETGLGSTPLDWQPRAQRPGLGSGSNGYSPRAADHSLRASLPSPVSAQNFDPLAGSGAARIPVQGVQPEDSSGQRVRAELASLSEPSAEPAMAEQRRQLAAKISSEIVSHTSSTGGRSAAPIEPGPGWQAVGEELRQHIAKCEQLLSRRAYLSAMEEANQGILRLVRVLDLYQNQFASEPTWAKAQQALVEAQQFADVQQVAGDRELFTRLIQSHETPALHGADVSQLTPMAAAQHYRAYAEQCLVSASAGHPWFSELYYCLGRSMQSQAESSRTKSDGLMQQALIYYRAAYTIDPSNAANMNQLGYVLLRMDRPGEAMVQLQEVIKLPDCPLEAWQNLAQASKRLGNTAGERWAIDNYLALKSKGAEPSGPVNTLVELTPQQFMAMSPRTVGPTGAPPAPVGSPMAPVMTAPASTLSPTPAPSLPSAPAASTQNRTATAPRLGIFR